jgi:hypothetical protein
MRQINSAPHANNRFGAKEIPVAAESVARIILKVYQCNIW